MADQFAWWKIFVFWLYMSRAVAVRKGHCRECSVRMCVRALPSVHIDCAVSMSFGRKRNQLTCFGMSKSVRSPMRGFGSLLRLLFQLSPRLRRFRVRACRGWTCSVGVLAAGRDWVICSRKGRRRYVESLTTVRCMPDVGVPEGVGRSTRNPST